MDAANPIFRMEGVCKRYGGVQALEEAALNVHGGRVHAVLGENGAGKSTLIKLLSGIHPHGSYEGELLVDGRTVAFHSIRDAEATSRHIRQQSRSEVPFPPPRRHPGRDTAVHGGSNRGPDGTGPAP